MVMGWIGLGMMVATGAVEGVPQDKAGPPEAGVGAPDAAAKPRADTASPAAKKDENPPQGPLPDTWENWHGYRLFHFRIDGVPCRLVVPEKAAPGKPWIWRARFFGHEPQFDLAMLERGYHVAYCEVGDLFGGPEAVRRWDAFYEFATTKLGLGPKPVLEGMSRGGLIVFNWAAAHPDRVAAIYADAPVCDIKSWPGGKGEGQGWQAGWKPCLAAYGLKSEEEALAFKGNPNDHAAAIAAARIPVIVVYGKADRVVPPKENCLVFAKRFRAAGGVLTLIGKDGCHHHPHSLKDPTPIVDVVVRAVAASGNGKDTGKAPNP